MTKLKSNHFVPPQFFRLVIVVCCVLLKQYSALSQQLTFNKVIPPSGSFSGTVGGIVQDSNGYMWIAGTNALYRYDGYKFKTFGYNSSAINSLSAAHLETVYADRDGIIWIATWINGLDRLDPATGNLTHIRHIPNDEQSLCNDSIKTILEDRDGGLWFGTTNGISRYDRKTRKFKNYYHQPNDPSSLSSNRVRKIYEDRQGILWVGTGSVWDGEGGELPEDGGLNRFDKKTGKFIHYRHDPADPKSLINNKVQAIFEDSRGVFWVGTAGDGLHIMNRETGSFERLPYDPLHPEKLSRPPLVKGLFPDHICAITEDAAGQIWIGTMNNGVNRYDPKSEKSEHFVYKSSNSGFDSYSAWSFYNSKDGILWIGNFEGSLYRIDPLHKNVPYFLFGTAVNCFNEDLDSNLWIGTNDGITIKNKNTGLATRYIYDAQNRHSLSDNRVTAIYRDQKGTMWIGTRNGLNRFNAGTSSFMRYQNSARDTSSICLASIVFTLLDSGGDSLWIGTDNGLDLMNKTRGTFHHFKNNPNDSLSIGSNVVTQLLREPSGNLWVGTYSFGGLNYYNCKTEKFTRFFKSKSVTRFLKGADGNFWLSMDDGIFKSSNPAEGATRFNDPVNPIEFSSINNITEDDQRNIWFSASTGIIRYNLQSNQTTLYGKSFGVNGEFLNFSATFKGVGGEMYYGDLNGYYVFSQKQIMGNPSAPSIAFTDLKIGGKSVLSDGSLLTSPLNSTKNMVLHYDQNVISIDFAGIQYSNPENNRHHYKLENYDLDWRDGGTEKTAYYFNLPPGQYAFKVKVASAEGVWAERSLGITITPPWWRTWWAYSLFGLAVFALAFMIHRIQKARVISMEREKTRGRELAQAKEIEKAYNDLRTTQSQLIQSEKMASLGELTAGIAHEIQNPLNFVTNFADVNAELIAEMKQEIERGNMHEVGELANTISDNEQKIKHHGKRADAIVKGMLQHSRTSTGIKEPTNLNTLADEFLKLAYHGLRAKDKTFEARLETDFDPTIGKLQVVPQDIGRVLLNLYNNAFYAVSSFAKAKADNYEPVVTVRTRKMADHIEITVTDNGTGIAENVKEKIFQPFFTTKPTGKGTGLGLSLSYDIITKGHNGRLMVESEEGKGAIFVIQLPTE